MDTLRGRRAGCRTPAFVLRVRHAAGGRRVQPSRAQRRGSFTRPTPSIESLTLYSHCRIENNTVPMTPSRTSAPRCSCRAWSPRYTHPGAEPSTLSEVRTRTQRPLPTPSASSSPARRSPRRSTPTSCVSTRAGCTPIIVMRDWWFSCADLPASTHSRYSLLAMFVLTTLLHTMT